MVLVTACKNASLTADSNAPRSGCEPITRGPPSISDDGSPPGTLSAPELIAGEVACRLKLPVAALTNCGLLVRLPADPDASAPLRAFAGSDAAPPRLRLVTGAPGDAKAQRKRRQRTR